MKAQLGKQTGIALALLATLLATLFAMGVFSVAQANHSATRSFSATTVAPGATDPITVTITLSAYQEKGVVRDELQGGFSLVSDSVRVFSDSGQVIRGVLDNSVNQLDLVVNRTDIKRITYMVTAPSDAGESDPPAFAGKFADGTGEEDIVGATMVTVAAATNGGVMAPSGDDCFGTAGGKNISSCEPGAAIRVEVGGTSTKAVGVNEDIIVDLSGFDVPATMEESRALVYSATGVAKNPGEVSINGTTVTLTVPNFNPNPTGTPVGLAANGTYSIVFKQSAGITNPDKAGAQTIKVTDNDDGTEDHEVTIQRVVKLSKTAGKRGTETVATLKGFADGTATVSLMAGGATSELDQVEITDNVATLTIDTTSAKFKAGKDANEIIVTDSEGDGQNVAGKFTISPTATLDPATTSVSKKVKVKLSDWTENVVISEVKIGNRRLTPDVADNPDTTDSNEYVNNGLPADATDRDINDEGRLTLEVTVPADVNRGSQTVKVSGSMIVDRVEVKQSASASLKIGVLSLSIQPAMVVPGQQITIQGSGFVSGDKFVNVDVGGISVPISPAAEASSAGEMVITIDVPSPPATNSEDAMPIGDGTKTISVVATGGSNRVAEGSIEIPSAAITLDPTSSRRGTTVNVSGSGFPSGDLVQVKYENNDEFVTVAADSADASGAVSISFVVPSYARIGSEHDVQTTSVGVYAPVTAEATHETPGAVVTLSAQQISSGQQISISGMNFPAFAAVAVMEIGGVDVRPVPAPATSIDGDFESTVLVPQLELGNQTVSIRVSQTTITTFLELSTVTVSRAPADVFASLGDRLVRVWYLERSTQVWSFYDPDPDVAAFNTLTEVSSGQNVSIIISAGANIGFQDKTLYPGTNPIALD